jgi:hypothetical protein
MCDFVGFSGRIASLDVQPFLSQLPWFALASHTPSLFASLKAKEAITLIVLKLPS